MGYRISKVVTRTGDNGSTGLADGSRLTKDAPLVQAMGETDELNSLIGVLNAHPIPERIRALLLEVQHHLFDIGGELAMGGALRLDHDPATAKLEAWVDALNAELPPLREFVLPGGTPAAAAGHHARTVCRRTERAFVALHHHDAGPNPSALRYLNRLSDLLFVIARTLARLDGGVETFWRKNAGSEAQ